MNIAKIQRLSEQHTELEKFHTVCCQSSVELSAKAVSTLDRELTRPTTQLFIAQLRGCIKKEMATIVEVIKREATGG